MQSPFPVFNFQALNTYLAFNFHLQSSQLQAFLGHFAVDSHLVIVVNLDLLFLLERLVILPLFEEIGVKEYTTLSTMIAVRQMGVVL